LSLSPWCLVRNLETCKEIHIVYYCWGGGGLGFLFGFGGGTDFYLFLHVLNEFLTMLPKAPQFLSYHCYPKFNVHILHIVKEQWYDNETTPEAGRTVYFVTILVVTDT
jgi:hypothetical protein